jgi:hypothetical protein
MAAIEGLRGRLSLALPRARTSCRLGEIPFVETACAREWERRELARSGGHGRRLMIRDEESESDLGWCEEAVLELKLSLRRKRKSPCHASQGWQAHCWELGRMTGEMREEVGLAIGQDCGKGCALLSFGERVELTAGCEENSPYLHRRDCRGSRQYGLHALTWRSEGR